ncbi:helix-turn-helix domain-containing protein [Nocardia sp. NBC_01503]|uniref:helix-turn-helix domain-containing protein n=1 Tax=Nocardia sp. NBC_01503 TaxID=2975997 RepID=UPI002E7B1244|nr:helix-turn-helix transcriptional regulator [Nocardia sp. NBC_01503]WTL34090.1 helix-turn-helix domain-containing protein [Nocardia sp. NBC_01503]
MAKPVRVPGSVARRQFGLTLRDARQKQNLDLKDVAEEMGIRWSISKLGRIERGETGSVSEPEIKRLAEILEIDDAATAHLIELAGLAAAKSWWYSERDIISGGFRMYVDLESSAKELTMYHNNIVPGLLQTVEYAKVLDRLYFPNESEAELDRRLKLKLERQKAVTRKTRPVQLTAVLHEAVAHTMVGGPVVMESQLGHLIEVSKQPNVSLRILPFTAGIPTGVAMSSYTILDLKDMGCGSQPPVVYFESLSGAACLEDIEDVSKHRAAMAAIRRQSLDEISTRTLLRQVHKKG